MPQDDVTRVRVGNSPVGIIGLKAVMEDMAAEFRGKSDGEIGEELLRRLSKKNYISDNVRDEYRAAFLREFRKFLGQPYEDTPVSGIEIKVLGPGCPQCERLDRELMEILAETGITAAVEHVRDIKEIGSYGVAGVPALIINGKIKWVGSVPPRSRLKALLSEKE